MATAGLDGPHASPKRLAYGFGVTAGIPLNLVQKWLGHSQRAVDDLVQAMGASGISKRQVLRLCGEIDERVKPSSPGR